MPWRNFLIQSYQMETTQQVDTLKQKYQKLIESQNISLYYADYRDCIEDAETVQKIALNDFDFLDEWRLYEMEIENIDYWMKENIDEEDEEFINESDEMQEFIRDLLIENNKSDYLSQVIRNSPDFIALYLLDIEGDGDYSSPEEVQNRIQEIHEKTGADKKIIKEILENSFYGGDIQFMFSMSPDEYIKAKNSTAEKIQFKGKFVLACADYFNGSGYSEKVDVDIVLDFEPKKLYLDGLHRYSFADSICGLMHSYFENDKIKLL